MYRIIVLKILSTFIVFHLGGLYIYAYSANTNKKKSASKETHNHLKAKVNHKSHKFRKKAKLTTPAANLRSNKPASGYSTNNKSNKYGSFVQYQIKKGDTLYGIAKKFNINVDDIYLINKLRKHDILKAHTSLLIPEKTSEKKFTAADNIVKKNIHNDVKQRNNAVDKEYDNFPIYNDKNNFLWPLTDVLSYSNDSYNGVKPIGLIIKGRSGGEILSSAAGIVKKIGYMRGFGNYIVLVHTGRFSTVYSRVGKVLVGEGESIHAGVAIGIIDNNTDILHFQIDYEGKPANPLKFLPPRS